jgi:hypothetical protein
LYHKKKRYPSTGGDSPIEKRNRRAVTGAYSIYRIFK